MKLGCNHPIRPLALADMIGLDVLLSVMQILHDEFADSKTCSRPTLVQDASPPPTKQFLVGLHFFNPVPVMSLVEIVRASALATKTSSSHQLFEQWTRAVLHGDRRFTKLRGERGNSVMGRIARLQSQEVGEAIDFLPMDFSSRIAGIALALHLDLDRSLTGQKVEARGSRIIHELHVPALVHEMGRDADLRGRRTCAVSAVHRVP